MSIWVSLSASPSRTAKTPDEPGAVRLRSSFLEIVVTEKKRDRKAGRAGATLHLRTSYLIPSHCIKHHQPPTLHQPGPQIRTLWTARFQVAQDMGVLMSSSPPGSHRITFYNLYEFSLLIASNLHTSADLTETNTPHIMTLSNHETLISSQSFT